MTRKMFATATVALAALLFAGCGDDDTASHWSGNLRAYQVPLPGGETVTCVRATGGGVSCDWDSAR